MQRHRRLVEGVRDRLVGLFVIFRGQLRFRPLPQRAGRIDLPRLALFRHKQNRKLDVVGIGADDAFDFVSLQVFLCLGLQVEPDLRSPRDAFCDFLSCRRDLKAIPARR